MCASIGPRTTSPIAQTVGRVFPGLFKSMDQMPEALRAHLRYPEDIFALQTAMYSTFHMTNPAVFYNKEDQWEVPAIDVAGVAKPMEPYYTIMRLPGEKSEEFILLSPFNPSKKDNMIAWMAARSDGSHYGKLISYNFPKQKLVYGPSQIESRINQNPAISQQLTLWDQRGSSVIRGNLLEDIGGDGVKPWGCDGVLVERNRLRGANQRIETQKGSLRNLARIMFSSLLARRFSRLMSVQV